METMCYAAWITYLVRSMYLRTLDFCTHIMVRNQLIYKCHRADMDHSFHMHRSRCYVSPAKNNREDDFDKVIEFDHSVETYSRHLFPRNLGLIARRISTLKKSINQLQVQWRMLCYCSELIFLALIGFRSSHTMRINFILQIISRGSVKWYIFRMPI